MSGSPVLIVGVGGGLGHILDRGSPVHGRPICALRCTDSSRRTGYNMAGFSYGKSVLLGRAWTDSMPDSSA